MGARGWSAAKDIRNGTVGRSYGKPGHCCKLQGWELTTGNDLSVAFPFWSTVMVSIFSWLSWSMQPDYSVNSSCIQNANGNLISQILYFLMKFIFKLSLKKNFQKLCICNYCTLWFAHQTEVLKWKVSQHGDSYAEMVMTSLLNIKSMTFVLWNCNLPKLLLPKGTLPLFEAGQQWWKDAAAAMRFC